MPALLTSTSMDLKRDSAVSTILAAVAGSPMWPSTRATWLDAATSVDWVTFRELATTLKPRSTKPFTIPAPIPCEAPVTMAVFRRSLMIAHLRKRSISRTHSSLASRRQLMAEFADAPYNLVNRRLATIEYRAQLDRAGSDDSSSTSPLRRRGQLSTAGAR